MAGEPELADGPATLHGREYKGETGETPEKYEGLQLSIDGHAVRIARPRRGCLIQVISAPTHVIR